MGSRRRWQGVPSEVHLPRSRRMSVRCRLAAQPFAVTDDNRAAVVTFTVRSRAAPSPLPGPLVAASTGASSSPRWERVSDTHSLRSRRPLRNQRTRSQHDERIFGLAGVQRTFLRHFARDSNVARRTRWRARSSAVCYDAISGDPNRNGPDARNPRRPRAGVSRRSSPKWRPAWLRKSPANTSA